MTFTFDLEEYINEVRQRLAVMGAPDASLALYAKISPAQLSRWLSGQTEPRFSSLARLERALERMEEDHRNFEASNAIDLSGRGEGTFTS